MPESTVQHPLWLRALAQAVVIVASVLMALGADAWWDGRQQRAEELTALRGLQADLAATLDVIAASRSGYEESAAAADSLISLTGAQPKAVSPLTVDTLLARAIAGTAFDPIDATLNALLNSDDLSLISNPALRSLLADWSPRMATIRRIEDQSSRQMLDHFMPYLHGHMPVRALDAIGRPETTGTRSSGFDHDSRTLLEDLLFENGLNDVLFYHGLLVDELDELEEFTERVLESVTSELQGG